MKRRIAVVTGSRADYGLLKPLIEILDADPGVDLRLLATGSHLSRRLGYTVSEIRGDGIIPARLIDLRLSGDSAADVARAMSRAVGGFARAYESLKPQLLVVLGDRYEVLAAASAAIPYRIPIAHIHGGESTEGAFDEQIRHAVTKISHLHFAATRPYRDRIVQMGEDPRRVFCFGAPGLDGLERFPFQPRERLERELRLPAGRPLGLMTYHPATLEDGSASRELDALLSALDKTAGVFWVCTLPNADPGFRGIIDRIERFARRRAGQAVAVASLGRVRYLSMMRQASVMVGNSSSGILEAPSFALPVVNVGLRQAGRLRAANVVDVPAPSSESLRLAIARALSPGFRRRLTGAANPYQGRHTCLRIAGVLKRVPLDERLTRKRFHAS